MRLLILAVLCAGCTSGPLTHSISKFAIVDPGVSRGGQPNADGFFWLYQQGYTNIVKLNTESEGSDGPAKALGMRVCYFPITTIQQVFGPVKPQLMAALTNINPGTFIHCTHGVNRTGTLVIIYRMKHDKWSKADAIKEADRFGWDTSLHALKDCIEDFSSGTPNP